MNSIITEEKEILDFIKDIIKNIIEEKNEYIKDYNGVVFTEEERVEATRIKQRNKRYEGKLDELKSIILNPYFARIGFMIKKRNDWNSLNKKIYVGKKGLAINKDIQIVDWRSPLGQTYYANNQSKFRIKVEKIVNEFKMILKRDIHIVEGKIKDVKDYLRKENLDFDNQFIDDFLLKIIENNRAKGVVSDIIATIQNNQHDIITKDSEINFIVQGCAGSGKTMILFHRLSYLLFNNLIGYNKLIILSPSKLFINALNNLSIQLGLEKVINKTLLEFYLQSINEYSHNLKVKGEFKDEYHLNHNFLKAIYSKSLFSKLQSQFDLYKSKLLDSIDKLKISKYFYNAKDITFHELLESKNMNDIVNDYIDIIHTEKNRVKDLKKEYTRILEKNFFVNSKTNVDIDHFFEVLSYIIILIKQYESPDYIYDYDPIIISREIDSGAIKAINKTIRYYNKLRKHYKKILDKDQQKGNQYQNNLIREIKDKINNINDILNTAQLIVKGEFKKLNLKIDRTKNIKEALNLYQKLHEHNACNLAEEDFIELIDVFKKEASYSGMFNNLFKKEINELLNNHNMQDMNIENYKFFYYLKLYSLYLYQGPLVFRENYLFSIDEFQDISKQEINLLYLVYPKSTYNLYGDVYQKIKPYGFDHVNIPSNYLHFDLKENYRNTSQINNFINNRLNMNNKSLGFTGAEVKTIKLSDINIDKETKKRIAIIISKKNKEISDYFSNHKPQYNKYVYVVEEIKGMEFDVVYVSDEYMTYNEKYISYSRGLYELYLIENNFLKD